MQGLVLDTHGSQNVTLDALRTLPLPVPRGARHQPIPHAVLVDALIEGITDRGWTVKSSKLGVSARGASLFGTLDLLSSVEAIRRAQGLHPHPEMGTTFGFRSSTDSSLSIRAVAGKRVFVCSNLCFSGEMFVLRRKSTTGLRLGDMIGEGLDKFLVQSKSLDEGIDRLKNARLTDADAKRRIFDLFNDSVLPSRLLKPMARHYFEPTELETDCQPRTLWGLNNSATRSIATLKPSAQFLSAAKIGKHFQLGAEHVEPARLSLN